MNFDRNTPMWQLTLGEFLQALQSITEKSEESPITESKEYVYGIAGLAKLIGCSTSHAARLKSQGLFNEAIIQRGRKIIIDKEKALELFKMKK
ncbi:DUF3853 family protein [Riemerella anatipestifer]|uniref:DUF3853 family protein n=1 Tax=Riemerella anatipestifer TaxID=34085 RepID=UPI0006996D5D|nr:DUF3853 family protein [Riemerella anatipestifer]MDR7694135.1 DUF3853 family protein [Riemerella anatipestifer]MDY3528895.1 DUF3853 family protein [Riemerella anatipestifer]MDY3538267.1 DUF3853 family protein [Riemerella anatipestifer]